MKRYTFFIKFLKDSKTSVGLPSWLSGKEPTASAEDVALIPGSERSPGKGNGNPLQYSCLGNPIDRGGWRGKVCGVAEESNTAKELNNSKVLYIT